MPALKAYADTTSPNWAGFTPRSRISSAPRGDRIMKSRTTVNCRNARIATTAIW